MPYKVLFRHHHTDRWFQYGADIDHEGHVFEDYDEAKEAAKLLNERGLGEQFHQTKVIKVNISLGVCRCATCSFALKHADTCTCGCKRLKEKYEQAIVALQ